MAATLVVENCLGEKPLGVDVDIDVGEGLSWEATALVRRSAEAGVDVMVRAVVVNGRRLGMSRLLLQIMVLKCVWSCDV